MLKIMLVDDDESDLFLTTKALSKAAPEAELISCNGAEEALSALSSASSLPDAVLADISMPKMDGVELLKKIKADEQMKVIPVSMLTNSSSPQDVQKSYQCGASGYFVKPTNHADFVELLSVFVKYWKQACRA